MSNKGLEFDPGFAPFIFAFRGTIEYLYMDINRFKNLSQRKMKFKQYHKKFLELFNNNLGFYVGCLMWAAYIKTQPEQEILNNNCLGQEYDEEANISDTEFMIKFLELFPKDMKYFLNEIHIIPHFPFLLIICNLRKDEIIREYNNCTLVFYLNSCCSNLCPDARTIRLSFSKNCLRSKKLI